MPETQQMPPPGMGHMATEARMVLLLDAVAMYLLEHDHRGSGVDDLGGALFWVSAQVTTVSSQMRNPVTGAPRRPASGVICVPS